MKRSELKRKTPLVRRTPLRAKSGFKTAQKRAVKATKPKNSVSALKKEADKWHSLATRYRFAEFKNGVWVVECVTCGVEKPIKEMQCGHFQSRRFNATRFSEINTAPQCLACNMFKHGEQYKYSLFLDKWYGKGTAKRLVKEAQEYHKLTTDELLEIISDSKTYIDFIVKNG